MIAKALQKIKSKSGNPGLKRFKEALVKEKQTMSLQLIEKSPARVFFA